MTRSALDELPAWARELLGTARVARLGLLDREDRPRVLPVTFAIGEGAVWSAIDRKPKRREEPARLRFLRRRPEAAVTVDHYEDDWTRLAWVQLLGRVEIVEGHEAAAGLAVLREKYEQYERDPPPGPFLRLTCERALSWRA